MSENLTAEEKVLSDQGAIFLRIDRAIWSDHTLTIEQKIIMNFVFQFNIMNMCCTFSPEWIAHKFGWEPVFVTEVITLLEKLGYIRVRIKDDNYAMSLILPGHSDPCSSLDSLEAI